MFTDSTEALANFEPQKYALALIDLKMGGLDGFGLYERILEHHYFTYLNEFYSKAY